MTSHQNQAAQKTSSSFDQAGVDSAIDGDGGKDLVSLPEEILASLVELFPDINRDIVEHLWANRPDLRESQNLTRYICDEHYRLEDNEDEDKSLDAEEELSDLLDAICQQRILSR